MKKASFFKIACVLVMATFILASSAWAAPWKFGVMSDTQWANAADATDNPGTVAVGIINQLNQQFINEGVKFVLQVGDLDDRETNYNSLPPAPRLGISTRAAATQALYDAGIGFFPHRGNHEGSATAAIEVQNFFPQTQGTGTHVFGATNFSSPSINLNGLSYSFDSDNVRFMLLDQFTPTDGKASDGTTYSQGNNAIASQQAWISSSLAGKPSGGHAFVFSHKQLFGGNHTDTLFNTAASNAAQQNAFISSLDANNVGYLFSGHDHMHNRSVVTSPDGASKVNQIICASDSYKFYTPVPLANHGTDAAGYNAGQISKNRETEISQELWSTGYYIVTIDGPRVTVDFYSADPIPETPGLADVDLLTTPILTFHKAETFGYSLNGKEVLVPQGGSYALTDDTAKALANGETGYLGTIVTILNGINGSTGKDYNNRALTKAVNTGWAPAAAGHASDKLTLWGMTDINATRTDTYALSLSYDNARFKSGVYRLSVIDKDGNANNAIVGNGDSSVAMFVNGPYNSSYPLGTHGIDTATKTAWAVVNHSSDFAVAPLAVNEVSSQISATTSGFVYNRATKLYTGNLTITNNGSAINTPVAVALNSLTPGVTLTNALGQYNNSDPYTTITNSGLTAGASITIPMQFSNPSNARINFALVTFQE